MSTNDLMNILKEKADYRFDNFEKIPEWNNLVENVDTESYIQKPIWIWGEKEYVILFIDLIDSSHLSAEKFKWTVAKIYDYFTQSIIDCVDETEKYSYIDIKWDGVFMIYEWEWAIENAFIDAINYRTFFSKYVRNKFSEYWVMLECKSSIYKDSLLVRKIWNRKFRNEVWAWKLVNTAAKLINYPQNCHPKYPRSPEKSSYLVLPKKIYDYLKSNHYDSAILSCCNWKVNLWNQHQIEHWQLSYLESYYVLEAIWCDLHWDNTISKILTH